MKQLLQIVIFSFILSFFVSPTVFAQKPSEMMQNESTSSAKPVIQEQAEYALPYPGILPDNPFYPVKMARDRFVGFLISDPLKKSEFDLLQSDKRVSAGIFLLNKNKGELAFSTFSKGENYFSEAISRLAAAKKQGMDTVGMARVLKSSAEKHQEVYIDLQ